MKRWRLNRKQKTIRNLLLCGLLGMLAYVMLCFPPTGVKAMCRQVQSDYSLPELEPLLVLRNFDPYDKWSHQTFVIARGGDSYISFQYERLLARNWRRYMRRQEKLGLDALCTARAGTLYVAAEELRQAETATAVVETAHRTFTLTGERLGEEVFGFNYLLPGHWVGAFNDRYDHGETVRPEDEIDLLDAVDLWYWEAHGNGGYGFLHADLPCTVTLRDAQGEEISTLHLTVDTYEIDSEE